MELSEQLLESEESAEKATFSKEYTKLREDLVIKNRHEIRKWIDKEQQYIHIRGESPMRTYVDEHIKAVLGHDKTAHWKVVWKRIKKVYLKLEKKYKWQNEPETTTLTGSR